MKLYWCCVVRHASGIAYGGRLIVRALVTCLRFFCLFMECSVLSARVRFVDGFVGVSDARLFRSRSVAYKCYWLARDVFGYGEGAARVAYVAARVGDAGRECGGCRARGRGGRVRRVG